MGNRITFALPVVEEDSESDNNDETIKKDIDNSEIDLDVLLGISPVDTPLKTNLKKKGRTKKKGTQSENDKTNYNIIENHIHKKQSKNKSRNKIIGKKSKQVNLRRVKRAK